MIDAVDGTLAFILAVGFIGFLYLHVMVSTSARKADVLIQITEEEETPNMDEENQTICVMGRHTSDVLIEIRDENEDPNATIILTRDQARTHARQVLAMCAADEQGDSK